MNKFLLLSFVTVCFINNTFSQIPVRFVNTLKGDQKEETVTIKVGKFSQTVTWTPKNNNGYIDIYFAEPGTYTIKLSAVSKFKGEWFDKKGAGLATINLYGGEIIDLGDDFSTKPYGIKLTRVGWLPGYGPYANPFPPIYKTPKSSLGFGQKPTKQKCSRCRGEGVEWSWGRQIWVPCYHCNGTGLE